MSNSVLDNLHFYYEGKEVDKFDKLTGASLNKNWKYIASYLDSLESRIPDSSNFLPKTSLTQDSSSSDPDKVISASVFSGLKSELGTAKSELTQAISDLKRQLPTLLIVDDVSNSETDKAASANVVNSIKTQLESLDSNVSSVGSTVRNITFSDSLNSQSSTIGASSKAAYTLNNKITSMESKVNNLLSDSESEKSATSALSARVVQKLVSEAKGAADSANSAVGSIDVDSAVKKLVVNSATDDSVDKPVSAAALKSVNDTLTQVESKVSGLSNTVVSDALDSDSTTTALSSAGAKALKNLIDAIHDTKNTLSDSLDLEDSDTSASSKAVFDLKKLVESNSSQLGTLNALLSSYESEIKSLDKVINGLKSVSSSSPSSQTVIAEWYEISPGKFIPVYS